MKSKYNIILQDGTTKEVYLKKHGKTYIAYCDQKEYSPCESGETVTFNGATRVVDSRVIFFDMDEFRFFTYFNQWAAPKLTVEKGVKVKSNLLANNFKTGLPLFIGFLVVIAVLMIFAFLPL